MSGGVEMVEVLVVDVVIVVDVVAHVLPLIASIIDSTSPGRLAPPVSSEPAWEPRAYCQAQDEGETEV
jgi:hypothetical protein